MHIKIFDAKIFDFIPSYLAKNEHITNMADNLPTIFMHPKKVRIYNGKGSIFQAL